MHNCCSAYTCATCTGTLIRNALLSNDGSWSEYKDELQQLSGALADDALADPGDRAGQQARLRDLLAQPPRVNACPGCRQHTCAACGRTVIAQLLQPSVHIWACGHVVHTACVGQPSVHLELGGLETSDYNACSMCAFVQDGEPGGNAIVVD